MPIFNMIIKELVKLGYNVIPTQDEEEYCIIPPIKVSLFWYRCDKKGVFDYYDKLVSPKKLNEPKFDGRIIYIGNLNCGFLNKADIVNASLKKAKLNARAYTIGRGHKQVDVFCEDRDLKDLTILSNEYKVTFYPKYDFMGNKVPNRYWGCCSKNNLL